MDYPILRTYAQQDPYTQVKNFLATYDELSLINATTQFNQRPVQVLGRTYKLVIRPYIGYMLMPGGGLVAAIQATEIASPGSMPLWLQDMASVSGFMMFMGNMEPNTPNPLAAFVTCTYNSPVGTGVFFDVAVRHWPASINGTNTSPLPYTLWTDNTGTGGFYYSMYGYFANWISI